MPTFGPLEPFPLPETRTADLQLIGRDRPAGRHASELTREMVKAAGANVESIEGEQEWQRAQQGFNWERALEYVAIGMPWWEALEQAWAELLQAARPVDKQLRLEYDGVQLTPDGFHREDRMLEEYKLTWKSASKWGQLPGWHGSAVYSSADLAKLQGKAEPEQHFAEWIIRSAMYLKALNESIRVRPQFDEHVNRADMVFQVRFIVFWVNGDYSHQIGRGPQPTQCVVTYTPEELDQTWRAAKRYDEWLTKKEKEQA